MAKNKKKNTNETGKPADKSGRQASGKNTKRDGQRKKAKEEDHLSHIPFRLREIMKSKDRVGKKPVKAKKPKEASSHHCKPADGSQVEDIPVPRFKRKKHESERAYVRRMENAAKHVLFLTQNQVERKPELDEDQQEKPAKSKSDRKREHDKVRLQRLQLKKLDRQEAKSEKEMFVDDVAFGEVAMAPPSLSAKPKKAPVKPQKASKELLLNSLLGHTVASTSKPSMAKQRIMEEERVRAVEAYRQLKKRKQLQREVRTASLGRVKSTE